MNTEHSTQESPPQFGMIDLVDAFTAFRHEYRNQSRESRTIQDSLRNLTERIESVADGIEEHAAQLKNQTPPNPAGSFASSASSTSSAPPEPARQWTQTLIEFDTQWTRAIEAAVRHDEFLRKQNSDFGEQFETAVASLSWFRRRLIAPFLNQLRQILPPASDASAITDGLTILLGRLRQVLTENQIERREAIGLPFDGEWMRSIGTINDPQTPSGHVAQELSPAYFSQGIVIKFADVRVASNH